MSIFMIFRVALKALNRNKMRTALTMLGMIIGVAAVITMVALGTGAQSALEAQIATAGTNMIQVQSGNYGNSGDRGIASLEFLGKLYIQGGHRIEFGYTYMRLDTSDKGEAMAAVEIARQEALRIEKKFSRYRDDNLVYRINHSQGEPVPVDEETARLIDYAVTCHALSDGLFDITSGVLPSPGLSAPAPAQQAVKMLDRQGELIAIGEPGSSVRLPPLTAKALTSTSGCPARPPRSSAVKVPTPVRAPISEVESTATRKGSGLSRGR